MKKARGRSGFLAVCIAPAVILFFVFMILPTLNVFRMSLFEKGAYSPNEAFVGLKNFKTLISDLHLFLRVFCQEKKSGDRIFSVLFFIFPIFYRL